MLGYDLWQLVAATGPRSELNATERTQPAMLAAGVATWRAVAGARRGAARRCVTGHSLGEFTALVCAGALDFAPAVDLVRFRGQADAGGRAGRAAARWRRFSGSRMRQVEAACREAAQGEVVEPVNFNSPGQVVIAGARRRGAARHRGCQGARRQARRAAAGERALALAA